MAAIARRITLMDQIDTGCQIYLIVPGDLEAARLNAVLASDALSLVSCVLLRSENGQPDMERARALLSATQKADIPLLLENAILTVQELGADGVHLNANEEDVSTVRATLGDDLILGARSDLTRHMAMSLSESGADYIAFQGDDADALADLVEWWSEVTVVPCVAWDVGDIDSARRFAEAGADFVSFDGFVWQHPEGPPAALRMIADAISLNQAAA